MQALTGGTSTLLMEQALRKAGERPGPCSGAMLHIDSPGGTRAARRTSRQRRSGVRAQKPIASHINGMGSSLAYRVAIEANHISDGPRRRHGKRRDDDAVERYVGSVQAFRRQAALHHDGRPQGGGQPRHRHHRRAIREMRKLSDEIGAKSFGDRGARARERVSTPRPEGHSPRWDLYAAPKAKAIGPRGFSIADTEGAIERFQE
jgi:hypothetical protein